LPLVRNTMVQHREILTSTKKRDTMAL